MMGGCDVPYSKFHADLDLYSMTQEQLCQLIDLESVFLDGLAPTDGTLIDGSQRIYEVAGNNLPAHVYHFDWSSSPSLPSISDSSFPSVSMQTNNHAHRSTADVNTIVMPCATYYYTDGVTQSPNPSKTVCDILEECRLAS